jgi:NADH-quinone oxidoreductase subunit A
MERLLLSPPAAFVILFAASLTFAGVVSLLSLKQKVRDEGSRKSYACGEDAPTNTMQPDYTQFFPFAFFFTILHVVALLLCTIPVRSAGSLTIAAIYILGTVTGLVIIFRR